MPGKQYSVVDIDAGLGGRSLAFLEAGFSISIAIESDRAKKEICQSILSNVPIITKPIDLLGSPAVPPADVFLFHLPSALVRGHQKAEQLTKENNLKCTPCQGQF